MRRTLSPHTLWKHSPSRSSPFLVRDCCVSRVLVRLEIFVDLADVAPVRLRVERRPLELTSELLVQQTNDSER